VVTGGVLERVVVRRPVGETFQRFVDHVVLPCLRLGLVYPFFDGCDTASAAAVDESVTRDNPGQTACVVGAGPDGGPMTTLSRAEIGALGEQLAVEHLRSLGLRVLERNWRCRYGELDVIAADDAARIVVFVEVKTRTSDQFGGVAQAVTPDKVRRLRRLAGLWLAAQNGRWSAVRIDVIGVRIGRRRTPELTHVQGVG
jgi:putative endonuclease